MSCGTVPGNTSAGSYVKLAERNNRQLEEEDGAAVRCRAAISDAAVVRADDVVTDGQAEAGAFTNGFGRIERLKQLGLVLGRHAGPRVLELDPRPAVTVAGTNR